MNAVTDTAEGFIAISKAAADPLRRDILKLLHEDSFGVLELCRILDIPQPALSHHLKLLHQSGLLSRRRDGTAVFYRRALQDGQGPLTAYIDAMFAIIDSLPLPAALATRVDDVYQARAARSRKFFADNAGALSAQQALISTPDVYLAAVADYLALSDTPKGYALDVGTGDGAALALLSANFTQVLGIDESATMLCRARQRVSDEDLDGVALRKGGFTALTGEVFDAILCSMVLHHSHAPSRFIAHAARLLGTGGLLLVIELCSHDQDWVRDACGDVWLGFEPADIDAWAQAAGLKPEPGQFLAQRNGFRLQIKPYVKQQG